MACDNCNKDFCSVRNIRLPASLYRFCTNGNGAAVDELLAESEKHSGVSRFSLPSPVQSRCTVKMRQHSKLGTNLKMLVEKEIGYSIQCSACLEFFRTLSEDSSIDSVVSGLLKYSPTPDWWRSKYKNRSARYRELIQHLFPVVSEPKQTKFADTDWSVVVTTAPRQDPTIEQCLLSLREAGWEPIVFAEPESYKPYGYNWIDNERKLGAWHNWLRSARWALEKTTAKYIMTVQDDSLFHPDSRVLAEQIIWPSNKVGFLSLYTASHYSTNRSGELKKRGVNRVETTSLWGACALIFPREALQQIIDHPLVPVWTGVPPNNLTDKEKVALIEQKKANPHLIQNVDTALGRIINGLHLEMWFVDPSPVQHVSQYSSIGHANNNKGKRNCLRCADHSKPLAEQVFS